MLRQQRWCIVIQVEQSDEAAVMALHDDYERHRKIVVESYGKEVIFAFSFQTKRDAEVFVPSLKARLAETCRKAWYIKLKPEGQPMFNNDQQVT